MGQAAPALELLQVVNGELFARTEHAAEMQKRGSGINPQTELLFATPGYTPGIP
jgi:hypothetical protein